MNELSALNVIFWVLVIILLVGGSGTYLLVRFWQDQTHEDLKTLMARLRFLKNESKTIHRVTQGYAGHDRPPYGQAVGILVKQLQGLDSFIQTLQTAYSQAQQDVRAQPAGTSAGGLLGTPAHWYRLRQQVLRMQDMQPEVEKILVETFSALEQLHRLGWDVALQSRQFQSTLQAASQGLQQIQDWRIQGDEITAAIEKEKGLQAALANIPVIFLSGQEEVILAQTDVAATIINVYQLLHDQQPILGELLIQIRTWTSQYQNAREKLAALQKEAIAARQQFKSMPQEILLTELDGRLKKIAVRASELETRLAEGPPASQLTTTGSDAQHAARVAQDIIQQLEKARQQQADLAKRSVDLMVGLESLAGQLGKLAISTVYPVDWENTKPQLIELQKKANDLGPAKMPRTPAELDKTLSTTTELLARCQDLINHYHLTAEKYEEIQPLLDTLEGNKSVEWCQSAEALADQVQSYHPENWPRQDAVDKFKSEVKALAEKLPGFLPINQALPVKETEINARLESVHQLSQLYQTLRSRETSIRQRLDEIIAVEKTAKEDLGAVKTVLNQVSLLARTNPVLQKIADKEIGQLTDEVEQLTIEFENQRLGTVDKKAQKISGLVKKVEGSCMSWLLRTNNDLRAKKDVIAGKLTTLKAIAQLDEPSIAEAEKLIAAGGSTAKPRPSKKGQIPLTDWGLELKQFNEDWQNCLASIHALEDLEKPILDAYQKLVEQRKKASTSLADASKLIPTRRDWPPTAQQLGTESQEYSDLEKQLEATEQDRNKASHLVLKLGDLTRRYQSVAQRSRSMADLAEEEQNRITDLENDLAKALQLWRNQLTAHSGNEFARKGIQNILDVANNEVNHIKRQYIQGKSYQQIEQGLIQIFREVNSAQVPVDNSQRIDINGEVRSGRGRF